MPFYGTLEAILEYAPKSPSYIEKHLTREPRKADGLETILSEKTESLRAILVDIERDIGSRAALSQKVIWQISQHYCYTKTKLMELYLWPLSANRAIEQRRGMLEMQLDALDQEQRKEQVQAWPDIAALKTEFRTWFKQYCDMAQRVRMILSGSAEPVPRKDLTR